MDIQIGKNGIANVERGTQHASRRKSLDEVWVQGNGSHASCSKDYFLIVINCQHNRIASAWQS
jgi:hypothetical protein